MARKKVTYKRKPRRKVYRRRRKTRSSLYNNSSLSGLPKTKRAVLRYVDSVTNNSATGLLAYKVFRANSIYDPYQSGIGHQPMGFDTWSSIYNHYVVLGAKISVKTLHTAQDDAITGIYLTDESTTPTYVDYTGFMEARRGTTRMISSNQIKPAYTLGKYSTKKFFNVTDVKDNFDRLGSLVTTNPTDQAYWVLWFQALNAATVGATHIVTIDYIVEFSEPKDMEQS